MSTRGHRAEPADPSADRSLADAVEQLVREFDPTVIYLFGSYLEGKARPESSVDVLVVAPRVSSVRFLDRIKRAVEATQEALPNLAPLVYTPEEIAVLQQQGDGFIQDIVDEGKVLYQRKD